MTNSQPSHLDAVHLSTVRGIAETIVALPYQLGYRPSRSVVMVCLEQHPSRRSTGHVQLIARADLDPPGGPPGALAALSLALDQTRPDVVVLIAFEDAQDDATSLLQQACELAGAHGALVDQSVRVRDGKWFPVVTPDGSAPCWQPLPAQADVPVVADLVLNGCNPAPERADLARLFESRRPLLRQVVTAEFASRLATGRGCVDPDAALLLLGHVLRADGADPPELSGAVLADLALELRDVLLRDAVLARVAPGVLRLSDLPAEYAERVVRCLPRLESVDPAVCERLAVLSSHLPEAAAAPLLTLCGYLAWWAGAGTLANLAIARALTCDPDYSMARLVDQVLQQAIRPPRSARGSHIRRSGPGHGRPAA
ncbi:MAG: DUF4192 domain-containing protein [Ornithinimicrobium sp.]|uniref:DUF4192 domain-containing protein n=1 Tax=Ornithinimicrobium sp. TaxID=1977084 RepID=UPI003D9AE385